MAYWIVGATLEHRIAQDLFNEELWKQQANGQVLVRIMYSGFQVRTINVIQYFRDNHTRSEESKGGTLHLVGDPVTLTYSIQSFRFPFNLQAVFPVIESIEKTMELLQSLEPGKVLLLFPDEISKL